MTNLQTAIRALHPATTAHVVSGDRAARRIGASGGLAIIQVGEDSLRCGGPMATAIVTAYGFCIAAVQPEAIGPLDHYVGDVLSADRSLDDASYARHGRPVM